MAKYLSFAFFYYYSDKLGLGIYGSFESKKLLSSPLRGQFWSSGISATALWMTILDLKSIAFNTPWKILLFFVVTLTTWLINFYLKALLFSSDIVAKI